MALTKVSRGLLSTGIVDNSTTTAITIDSSENVGIGTSSPIAKIDILGTNYVVTNSGQARGGIHIQPASGAGAGEFGGAISFSTGGSGSSAIAAVNTGGSDTDSNGLAFFTHPSGTGSADAVENMRITEAGHVGLGTNAPGSLLDLGLGSDGKNQISWHNDATTSYGNIFQLRSNAATVIGHGLKGSETVASGFEASTSNTWGRSAIVQYYGDIKFYTNPASATTYGAAYTPSERMRVDSLGNLLVGTTSSASTTVAGVRLKPNQTSEFVTSGSNNTPLRIASTNDVYISLLQFFTANNTLAGYLLGNGSALSLVSNSDYRLKENVVDLTGATERLKQLPVHRFNFINNPNETVDGFLAHEVKEIVPEAAHGTKDAMMDEEYEVTPAVLDDDDNVTTEAVMGTRSVPDYQGIDQSKLVPLLVATIQELEARLTALENN